MRTKTGIAIIAFANSASHALDDYRVVERWLVANDGFVVFAPARPRKGRARPLIWHARAI